MSMPEVEAAAKKRTRAELVTRLYLVFVGTVAVAALVLISVVTLQNAQRGKENRETLHIIKDCTQATGSCKRQGEEQTAKAVSGIVQGSQRASAAAAACALTVHPVTFKTVYRCVRLSTAQPIHKR